ncbi:pseudouridine synthase [Limnohabitans sp.]|uniref:pseudouridine synthase n=1 Tax=Limnohabitans sp. TaxID=1907725 RepID=UPI0035B1EDB2
MAHVPKNPNIAMRDGVSPSCLALPRVRQSPWPALIDHLAERLPRISRSEWTERMQAGSVLGEDGQPLAPDAPYVGGARVYYWRELPREDPIPFEATVLFEDAHLVVADKPHFLPVTPGGRYVRETLLVRLKAQLGCADLSPLHRIDRETAGLVLLCKRPQDRDAYQSLFRERRVDKVYEAVAGWREALQFPLTRRSHILEDEQAFYRMREAQPDEGLPPNSETRIECVRQEGARALYRLFPVSGKRHQLRVHMHGLGLPIEGDQFYPVVRRGPNDSEDFAEPLQLLARSITFTDPVTGQPRQFESGLELAQAGLL